MTTCGAAIPYSTWYRKIFTRKNLCGFYEEKKMGSIHGRALKVGGLLLFPSASFLGWIVSFNLFKNADADFLLQLGSGVSDVRI